MLKFLILLNDILSSNPHVQIFGNPCGSCRKNFKKNLKKLPLKNKDLKNRYSFSLWVYYLHE